MASQHELDNVYMKMAYDAAELSKARRRKVGAILVIPNEGRFEGVNGTPSGFDNNCEDTEYWTAVGDMATEIELTKETAENLGEGKYWIRLVTKPEVLHAESNAIMKVARSHASSAGGTIYCTLLPCLECAKLIIQAGIVRVVYSEEYPYPGHNGPQRAVGLVLLQRAGIQVDNLPMYRQNVSEKELAPNDEGYHDPSNTEWGSYRP